LAIVIVATAGHVDHGKTLLVRALTGVDTDRLPEEKARGLSIELGYAFHDLGDGEIVGFIDVPGHERFVRTMVAGVAGTDCVLFVVAADDGPMPQTAEHLAILDLLGVSRGLVVLSKCDRVDAARIAEVTSAIRALLAGTTLADCAILPVSALSGEGMPALREALLAEKARVAPRAADGNFRLAVDRSFVLKGAGRVVTGTVFSGRVAVGDSVWVAPDGGELRVRAIHAQNASADHAQAGRRCALNLVGEGLREREIARGEWIVARPAHFGSRRLDALLRVLPGEAAALRPRAPVHVHVGAAETTGRVLPLDGLPLPPGAEALVQLQLDAPLHAVFGDRVILRDASARRTLGGGRIVNPLPEERRHARGERLRVAQALCLPEATAALTALLALDGDGIDLERFAAGRNLSPAAGGALRARADLVCYGPQAAPLAVAAARWQACETALLDTLARCHAEAPELRGVTRAEFRAAAALDRGPALFDALIEALVARGAIAREEGFHRLPGHVPVRNPADERMWQRLRPLVEVDDRRVPVVSELAAALGVTPPLLEAFLLKFVRQGLLVRVSAKRHFTPAMIERQRAIARELAAGMPGGRFTAADFRDRSGLGRNAVIELLEYFDRTGLTRREGDSRLVIGREARV
jgi:selenocysteine-specific elongation factor